MHLLIFRKCSKYPPGAPCPFCKHNAMFLEMVPKFDDRAFTLSKDHPYEDEWIGQHNLPLKFHVIFLIAL